MGFTRNQVICIAGSLPWLLSMAGYCQDAGTRALVGLLGSEDFRERTKAQLDLSRWALDRPEVGQDWLMREFEAAGDPEVRVRLREVLKEVVIAEHQKDGPGYVGITMEDVQVQVPGREIPSAGVRVGRVMPDTPADRAGLLVGDVIVSLDNRRWEADSATLSFAEAVKKLKPGDQVEISILRAGELKNVPVKLAARPMGLPEVPTFPGLPFRVIPLGPMDLKAQDEGMKALDESAKEDCFENWLEQRRAGPGKP